MASQKTLDLQTEKNKPSKYAGFKWISTTRDSNGDKVGLTFYKNKESYE